MDGDGHGHADDYDVCACAEGFLHFGWVEAPCNTLKLFRAACDRRMSEEQ